MKTLRNYVGLLTLAVVLIPTTTWAALERVGPINPTYGFPAFYQDSTGLALDLCVPTTQAELDAGYCLLLNTDVTLPESIPNNFFDEHFYWAAAAFLTYNNDDVELVLALEATFAPPSDRAIFGRLRIRMRNVPVTGVYKFYTPYGVFEANGVAGDRIFETRDLGLEAFGVGALRSDIGPFLLPATTPGGAELAVHISPDGRRYVADPNYVGPVTGSPFGSYVTSAGVKNANIFRVEGPVGAPAPVETFNFEGIMGRLYADRLPADMTTDRVSYTRTADARQVSAYVTGRPIRPGRIPGPTSTIPPPVIPSFLFYTSPCGGLPNGPFTTPAGAAVLMSRNGDRYFAGTTPAAIPVDASGFDTCIALTNAVNGLGDSISAEFIPARLGDQIGVTEAFYDRLAKTLSVKAQSFDVVTPPVLTVAGFGNTGPATLTNGAVVIPNVEAAPESVTVNSNLDGSNKLQVSTERAPVIPATDVLLFADTPSPKVIDGAAVTFLAQGVGSSNYQYEFWHHNGTAWSQVQAYSPSATWVFTGALQTVGTHRVVVHVRTNPLGGADFSRELIYQIVAAPSPATGVTLLPGSGTMPAGTPVKFTATGSGGSGTYLYQFWYFDGTTWTLVQDWSPVGTWTSTAKGLFWVAAHVKTSPAAAAQASAMSEIFVP